MSKIYVKLVNKCNDCPNIYFYMFRAWGYHAQCKAANFKTIKNVEAMVDKVEIPDWCPLETGEAVYIISNCKYCEFSDKQGKHPYCNYNGKFIKLKPNQNIPDWCLLKIKENSNENSNS